MEHIMPKQLKAKDIKLEREHLSLQQNNICPLCERIINDGVLDHCHRTHYVRATICRNCNTAEGALNKMLIRSGLVNTLTLDGAYSWLTNVLKYYQQDYSLNSYHPNRINDLKKQFKRLNKPKQLEHLDELKIKHTPKHTQLELNKLYHKHLKESK